MASISTRYASFAQFAKVGLTIAQVLSAEVNANAKIPAYLLNLNFSEHLLAEHRTLYNKQVYTSSAQLRANHSVEDLNGALVMSVYNFARKQIGKLMSDCLVTGAQKMLIDPEAKRATTVFIRPRDPVQPGARIGLLAEDGIYTSNARNLEWEEFTALDLRIGTVTKAALLPTDGDTFLLDFDVDLGDGAERGVGLVREGFDAPSLVGRQVMVLANLHPDEISRLYPSLSQATIVLCTVAGRTVLEPAKPIENGFKIA